MKIPENMTEGEVLALLEKITKSLAAGFVFGFHTYKDILQTAMQFALESLELYEVKPGRSLDKFLYCSVKNKLINFKRDKLYRPTPPCDLCSNCASGSTGHADGQFCKKYLKWRKRNSCKQNIMNISTTLDFEALPSGFDTIEEFEINEVVTTIEARLKAESLFEDYLQMKGGASLSVLKREAIMNIIRGVLCQIIEPADLP